MEEKKEKSYVSLPYFGVPRLLPYLKRYRLQILTMVLLGIAGSAVDSAFPLFNRYAINHFIGEKTLSGLGVFVLLYAVTLLAQVVANFTSTYLCSNIEISINRDLRDVSFNHLQTLSFSYFNQNNVGYIHARVMSDTGRIGELVAWHFMDLVWNLSYLIMIFVVMIRMNLRLALFMLALIPPMILVFIFFQKKLVTLHRRIREINSKITSDFNEGITGAKTIKTLVVEDTIRNDFEKDTADMKRTSVHSTRVSALFGATMSLVSSIALALVLWQGGNLTMERVMEIGTLSVFMSYALNMIEPIQMIIETFSMLIQSQVNIERLMRLIDTESDVADSKEVTEKYGDTFNPKKENWEELYGDVEFKDVSFMYPDGDEWVLEHFNLKIPQGTNVAIVGETGAGKSTLVNLVCRFFEPTKGQVLIDGRDARERSQLWLHSNIGYVLQTPHLFSGSVRENLMYGNPTATDDEIWRALDIVSARGVVERMDKGLDSEVGEGGDLLSTGEKQLLSFARAILADPRILVLDEATSSIDTVTEKIIQDAIGTVIKGRTSFVIAHRLSTVVDADVILVVKDGKIIEQGRHADLMKAGGYYHSLFTRQYEDMATENAFAG